MKIDPHASLSRHKKLFPGIAFLFLSAGGGSTNEEITGWQTA